MTKNKGLYYEQQAEDWLAQKGLSSIDRNYHSRFGEIDLIMQDKDTICFIEVKFRNSLAFGGTAYSIPPTKQQKIIRTAQHFISTNKKFLNRAYRFDAFLIQQNNNNQDAELEWIQNAFSAEGY